MPQVVQAEEKPAAVEVPPQEQPIQPQPAASGGGEGSDSVMPGMGRGSKGLPKPVVLVILGVLLLAGLLLAYFKIFAKSPEEQIQAAIADLIKAESAAFDGEFRATGGAVAGIPPIGLAGQIDKEKARIELSLEVGGEQLKATLLAFEDDAYIKIDGLSNALDEAGGSFGLDSSSDLATLDGQYIRLDQSVTSNLRQLVGGNLGFGAETDGLSDDDAKKLAEVIADADLIIVQEKLEAKEINGKKAKGYKVVLNREGLIEFTRKLKELDIEGIDVTDESIKNLEDLDQDELNKEPVNIWLQGGSLAQIELESDGNTLTVTFSEIGGSFSLEKPDDFITLEEALGSAESLLPLLGGGFDATTPAEEGDLDLEDGTLLNPTPGELEAIPL